MTPHPSDLATWLLERLAEDEQAAKAATPGPWEHWEPVRRGRSGAMEVHLVRSQPVYEAGDFDDEVATTLDREDADLIATHDPARVLRQVAAHRAIVRMYQAHVVSRHEADALGMLDTLRALASIYADRPGWQEEWA